MTTDTRINLRNHYQTLFEGLHQRRDLNGQAWIHPVREEALRHFVSQGFPTTRDEEWKYTSVAPIARTPFTLSSRPGDTVLSQARLLPFLFAGKSGVRLVFVNGDYAPHLSTIHSLPKGVWVGSLSEAMRGQRTLVEPALARYAAAEKQAFTALNTAFLDDGAFVHVPRGTVVTTPIHVLFVSDYPEETSVLANPRSLITVGEQAQVTVIESYVALQNTTYLTNAVTEIVQGEHAVVDHYKVQKESERAFHIATTQVQQDRNSTFSSLYISLGGALIRNDVNTVLDSEGCECHLNGLYVIHGQQHEDNHTRIDHAKAHCNSHELYKGILSGRSTGVFNGKVYVHPDAQKTDAKQTNKNLILSEGAQINTKPQLEIFADDVKCTHGATIGQLDEDALFYLRARGIDEEHAKNILVCAFARDIIDRIRVEPLRIQVELTLLERLEKRTGGKDASWA